MATGSSSYQLTNKQIVRLAETITGNNMSAIAEGYMGISSEIIKNKKYENKDDVEAFNRDIIRHWMNKNPDDQVKKLADLLYEAASDSRRADLWKIEEILTVSRQEGTIDELTAVRQNAMLEMAEHLRPQMEQSMKMEPVPWIRDYLVDMDDRYTDLILEKIDNKPSDIRLESYQELFVLHKPGMLEYLDIRHYYPGLIPKRKILIKADPGMGKTSLVKKVTWDWAKRLFVKVSIVFFVFLKLVKPGDFIEDAIIQQTHVLEGKHVTKKELNKLLESCGDECLLILDGLDECALGQNEDVLRIIVGSKFVNCNVILTSRPHSTREFERYFDTIVSIEGFTRSEAKKFASRIVPDKSKLETVLNFNPAAERADRSVHNVPILLSFLCLLVKEDPDINLSDQTISKGEIYFRMVQCLYKKFTIRKGIGFKTSSFFKVLASLGKLALETLLSGNPLLQRSQIIAEVGPDAFDYGLLIGHEDFRLIRDETADIFVTFPHRSLLEFLGAFYFVQSLGANRVLLRCGKAIQEYLPNPLFSEFCLWFLDDTNDFFPFPKRSVAYQNLASYVAVQIDCVEVNSEKLVKNLPAMNPMLVRKNEMAFKILEEALAKCRSIKHLEIYYSDPTNRILRSIGSVAFTNLKSIAIYDEHPTFPRVDVVKTIPGKSPLYFLNELQDRSIFLVVKCFVNKRSISALDTVLQVTKERKRSVYLRAKLDYFEPVNHALSCKKHTSVEIIDLCNSSGTHDGFFVSMSKAYPELVSLFLSSCDLDSRHLSHLAKSTADNYKGLQKLSTLDMSQNPGIGCVIVQQLSVTPHSYSE